MRDLQSLALIKLKGLLFLFIGVVAAALLLWLEPTWTTFFLLSVCIWGFCRAYYFAFYVIEHYVDGDYKFSGLGSFLHYWFQSRPPMD